MIRLVYELRKSGKTISDAQQEDLFRRATRMVVDASGSTSELAPFIDDPQKIEVRLKLVAETLIKSWQTLSRDTHLPSEEETEWLDVLFREVDSLAAICDSVATTIHPKKKDLIAVDLERNRVRLGGTFYAVTERQAAIVQALLRAGGGLVPGPELKKYPGSSERPDRIIQRLPPEVRECIKGESGKGYRLVVPVE
jgi:hypothetical protein